MEDNKQEDAWDDKEFENTFDLFEEDGGGEGRLDRGEFTKLIKKIT